ncbi:unnamed protein product, partial [Rotaria sp. Silwood1]
MVIDNAEKTLYISHGIADMRHLRDLFIQIWVSVNNRVEQSYSEENVNKIHQYIQLLISNKDLKIPSTLKNFVDRSLKTWISNAYCAKYIEDNDNYIIGDVESTKNGEILIMDKDTGVEQLNTRWSNGLHQFLQLKHCGKLSDESLKAVFISNMNFFKLYDNLNGMTGTIGGQEERELLSLEYGVDCFELPRFRKYRFRYEKTKECVCKDEDEWCEQIIADINEKMDAKRHVSEQEKTEIEEIQKQSEILLEDVKKELEILVQQRDRKIKEKYELIKQKNTYDIEKRTIVKEVEKKWNDDVNNRTRVYKSLEICEQNINVTKKAIDQIDQDINSSEDTIRFRQTQIVKLERNIQHYQQILGSGENRDRRRAVLVICENIASLEKIAATIRQKFQSNRNCNIYTYDRAYRKFEKSELNPGDIIIATNIAGRGTDLTIDKLLEANGGLHVILSYIPGNLRVQQQVFGRTARGGKRGTGVYIVYDLRKLMLMPDITIDFLLQERDDKEKERLQDIVSKSFPKIKTENNLFDEFNLFKEEIKSNIQESIQKSDHMNEMTQIFPFINRIFRYDELDFNANFLELQLNSLQNHWALWLNEMDEKLTQVYLTRSESILEEFSKFKQEMSRNLSSNRFGLVIEPGELVKLSQLFMDHKKYKEAQDCYDDIIEKHPDFSDIAHYYKAFCIIHLEGGAKDEKLRAKTHLKKALDLLESRRNTIMSRNQILQSLNQITQQKGQGLNVNYFRKQNEGEAQILSHHINAILEAIGSEIASENFRQGKITGDIPNEVYKELLKDKYNIIKDNRINTTRHIVKHRNMIKVSDDFKDYLVGKLDDPVFCSLGNDIKSLLLGQKLIRFEAGDRINNETFFKTICKKLNMDEVKCEMIQILFKDLFEETIEIVTHVSESLGQSIIEKLKGTELDESFPQIQQVIREVLSGHEMFPLSSRDVIQKTTWINTLKEFVRNDQKLSDEQLENILKYLEFRETLRIDKNLEEKFLNNTNNEIFCDFQILRSILQDNDVIQPKLISEDSLSLRTADEVSKELWCRLRELTVIKEARVNFKFTNDPEKRIEIIQQQIESVVEKIFGLRRKEDSLYTVADWTGFGDLVSSENKELDEYIDSITNVLKNVAGVFRTIPKVKIEEKNLKAMFQTGKIPPELMDYVWMCFDSVLSLKEDKGFWDWDAFACAMIGIGQIVAGIAIDICTCGLGHYFAQALIAEGIGDIIFAIQSGIQGNFSWKAYCQHKVQSLIISLLTAGVGSYLGKGAQAGKMALGLATKTAVLKAIGKETITQLITGVTAAIVNITADELSRFVMNEILEKHFYKIFDQWVANNEIYKEKKIRLAERFESIYQKFGAQDAGNLINDATHATLLDLHQGDLANAIFNRVTQIAHGISGAYSAAARTFKKGSSKAVLFTSIAKIIDTTVKGFKFYKNLVDICVLCNRFCEILDKKLSERFQNNKAKSNTEKIKEENQSISISARISEHIKSMEDQMKIAMKEKVRNDFLKPGIQFTFNHAVKPIKEFITSPFANAMEELKDHIDQRAEEYMKIVEKKGHEALNKLSSRKKRALEQLGCLSDVKNMSPQVLKEKVSNLNGESIQNLIKQHGDNVKIAIRNGKLYAVLPTYKEYMDNIESGIYAGPMHFKLAAEKFKAPIEVLDPENGFQPHADAPDGGIIYPTKISSDKPIKVAFIKSNKKGDVGHFAPVIEVNGELRVANINQDVDTTDQCFAQTMLFIEKYNAGTIKDIDFDGMHDYGISKGDTDRFNANLAQLGRSSQSMREVYNEGLTLEHPEFLGGGTIRSRRVTDLGIHKKRSPRSRTRDPNSEGDSGSENPLIAYRSLRPDEEPRDEGLRPPEDHDPEISIKEHVAHGSRAKKKSSWVSASRSIKVAGAWASENKRLVAEFDVPFEEKLPYEERSVFDLTDPSTQNYVFGSDLSMPKNFAKSSQEIVIKGGVDA